MKVAIITANIGGIDPVYPPCTQSEAYELFYYTENTLPFPLPALDSRMKGRYFKTQINRHLDHDYFIWIDASVEIVNEEFVKDCITKLQDSDIIISKHEQRQSVFDEIEYIIEQMKKGNKYLLRRYIKQPLYKEYEYYRDYGMSKSFPLYNGFMYAVKNNAKTSEFLNEWWDLIIKFSNFDQSQLSFCLWKHKFKIECITPNDYFIRHKHPGYNL